MTAAICPECGHHTTASVSRGPLTVQTNPTLVLWKGQPLNVTAPQAQILHVLASHGEATTYRLELLCIGEDSMTNALRGQVSRLRKVLPPAVRIKSK
jgi:DNA-binding response OmpR family regulator